jgi:hypothetical protein
MRLITLMASVAAIFVLSQSAQAREHHARHYAVRRSFPMSQQFAQPFARPFARPWDQSSQWGGFSSSTPALYGEGAGPRPAAWCGWEMRQLVGGDPGPQYNLARNWAHWGHSGPAGVGAVVVWSHHVGKIVGQQDGQWLIESGNDGHAVRTRVLSINNAIAVRWG